MVVIALAIDALTNGPLMTFDDSFLHAWSHAFHGNFGGRIVDLAAGQHGGDL